MELVEQGTAPDTCPLDAVVTAEDPQSVFPGIIIHQRDDPPGGPPRY